MKHAAAIALFTITFFQLASYQPLKGDVSSASYEKERSCKEACGAFEGQTRAETRSCVNKCADHQRRAVIL